MMNTMTRNALNAYSKVAVEAGVITASPHRLIAMLFEGAIIAVTTAKLQMQRKDIAAKGLAISKAIAIIDEGLKVSLDDKAGGELAQNLKALYEYMCQRLLMANLKNEIEPLDEVSRLLNELNDAWCAIGKPQTIVTATVATPAEEQMQNRAAIRYGAA